MTTKFVLNGGNTSENSQSNFNFFKEADVAGKNAINILVFYLHHPKEENAERLEKNKKQFSASIPGKELKFQIAETDPGKFSEQIKWCDVFYVPGGNTFLILDVLREVPNFGELLNGRIYLGSSAGSYVVCKYFYENEYPGYYSGLGLLPYKIVAHYYSNYMDMKEKDWDRAVGSMKKHKEELEIIALKEQEYKIVEK